MSNLSYEFDSGRLSALGALRFICDRFPSPLINQRSELLLLPLVARLDADESQQCRAEAGRVIQSLLARLDDSHLDTVFRFLHTWISENDLRTTTADEDVVSLPRALHFHKLAAMVSLPFSLFSMYFVLSHAEHAFQVMALAVETVPGKVPPHLERFLASMRPVLVNAIARDADIVQEVKVRELARKEQEDEHRKAWESMMSAKSQAHEFASDEMRIDEDAVALCTLSLSLSSLPCLNTFSWQKMPSFELPPDPAIETLIRCREWEAAYHSLLCLERMFKNLAALHPYAQVYRVEYAHVCGLINFIC